MAIFRNSPVTGPISGNVGPVNFVAGAQGNIIRSARRAIAARSPEQLTAHAWLKSLSASWAALNTFEQDAWRTAAKSVPSKNRLGLPKILNGRQFFIAYNMPTQIDPPALTALTPPLIIQSPSRENFQVNTLLPDQFRITWNLPFAPAAELLFIYGFRPYLNHPTRHTPYWTRIAILILPAFEKNILPETELALGTLVDGEHIHFRVWWREQDLLDSGVQLPTTIANIT